MFLDNNVLYPIRTDIVWKAVVTESILIDKAVFKRGKISLSTDPLTH